MTFDPTEFLFEHKMIEASVEFTDPGGCGRHIHGFLASTKHDLDGSKFMRICDFMYIKSQLAETFSNKYLV